MVNTVDSMFTIATTILECVNDRIVVTGGLPEFERVCVVPGEIAWDACDCGQLTINNPSQFSSNIFPTPIPGGDQTQCGAPVIASTFNITALRCSPSSDRSGHPPTCSQLQNAAELLYKDKYYMRAAAICCLAELQRTHVIEMYTVGTVIETGPRGGCVGAEMPFTVGLINNCPCE